MNIFSESLIVGTLPHELLEMVCFFGDLFGTTTYVAHCRFVIQILKGILFNPFHGKLKIILYFLHVE